jgi:mRNA interferase MazF
MGLIRGDIVIVSAPGDYGKPRPALVLQSNVFSATESVVVALITSAQHPEAPLFRKAVVPCDGNGLRQASDVMIDKLVSLPRKKLSKAIGHLSSTEMASITASLALFLGMERAG